MTILRGWARIPRVLCRHIFTISISKFNIQNIQVSNSVQRKPNPKSHRRTRIQPKKNSSFVIFIEKNSRFYVHPFLSMDFPELNISPPGKILRLCPFFWDDYISDPFQRLESWPPNRGWKGHGLNHLASFHVHANLPIKTSSNIIQPYKGAHLRFFRGVVFSMSNPFTVFKGQITQNSTHLYRQCLIPWNMRNLVGGF